MSTEDEKSAEYRRLLNRIATVQQNGATRTWYDGNDVHCQTIPLWEIYRKPSLWQRVKGWFRT